MGPKVGSHDHILTAVFAGHRFLPIPPCANHKQSWAKIVSSECALRGNYLGFLVIHVYAILYDDKLYDQEKLHSKYSNSYI